MKKQERNDKGLNIINMLVFSILFFGVFVLFSTYEKNIESLEAEKKALINQLNEGRELVIISLAKSRPGIVNCGNEYNQNDWFMSDFANIDEKGKLEEITTNEWRVIVYPDIISSSVHSDLKNLPGFVERINNGTAYYRCMFDSGQIFRREKYVDSILTLNETFYVDISWPCTFSVEIEDGGNMYTHDFSSTECKQFLEFRSAIGNAYTKRALEEGKI